MQQTILTMLHRGLFIAALMWTGYSQAASGTVTFIQLNDLHAHLTPHTDLVPAPELGPDATRIVEHGGLARTATLIKQIRATNTRSVLMNIGDTFHGGVEALFTLGNAIVDPVNLLGIDVGVPGNWDYAYGPAVMRARFDQTPLASNVVNFFAEPIKRPNYPNLAANVKYTTGRPFLPATLLKDLNGIQVGFIGLTSDIVEDMSALLAIGFSFSHGQAAHQALIEQHAANLRQQGADLVVVMSELGIHKDYQLAQIIKPGAVDIIFSAHTHETTFEPLTTKSGIWLVEAGNAGYLGRMDVELKNGKIIKRNWQLLEIDANLAEDANVARAVQQARAPFLAPQVNLTAPMVGIQQTLTQPIDTVIGYTQQPLDRRHALESTFNNAHTDQLRRHTGTDIAIAPGFRFDNPLAAPGYLFEDNTLANGAITLEDAYRYFPIAYSLATAETDGANLRAIIEASLTAVYSPDAFRQFGGWMPGLSGVHVELDLSRPDGARIVSLQHADGRPILPTDRLTASGCRRPIDALGSLCSYPGFSNIEPLINPHTGQAYTVVDFLVTALAQGPLAEDTRQDLLDLNATPVWPATPYVQPLVIP